MSRDRYVVVQRTGFVPYFLCAWRDTPDDPRDYGDRGYRDSWDCLRARALMFDGPTARRIKQQLVDRNPMAVVPVHLELVR